MSCGERPNVLSQFFVLPAVFFALPDQRLLLYGKLGGGGEINLNCICKLPCGFLAFPWDCDLDNEMAGGIFR